MRTWILGAICLVVLCVILTLGLWPFHVPHNAVSWLHGGNGLAFGRYGTVLSAGTFDARPSRTGNTIELRVQTEPYRVSTMLSFYDAAHPFRLELRQFFANIEFEAGKQSLFVPGVLRDRPVLITLTSGANGTRLYIEGVEARHTPFPIPPAAFRGRLILGDAPHDPDSFRGEVLGLAVYDTELTPRQVSLHNRAWTHASRPEISADQRAVALYGFEERTGRVVHNAVRSGANLEIPDHYTIAAKYVLEPFWDEFELTGSYWGAVLKNIVGFIPVGFWFYPFLTACRARRATLVTVLIGFSISVVIEVLQAFLPTRDSGTSDIFTNTFGTWLGAVCYRSAAPFGRRWLPSL